MTIPDPRTLAAALKRAADRADLEHGPAVQRSRDWKLGIPANAGDGIRAKGGHGDPTLARVLARTDHAAGLHRELDLTSRAVLTALEAYLSCLDKCKPTRTERAEANDLEERNALSGQCDACVAAEIPNVHVHSGRGDDRLRRVATGERVDGQPLEPKLCNACRMAWTRRPYSDAMLGVYQEWDAWLVSRVEHLRQEAAA